jgi:hypothetical protein
LGCKKRNPTYATIDLNRFRVQPNTERFTNFDDRVEPRLRIGPERFVKRLAAHTGGAGYFSLPLARAISPRAAANKAGSSSSRTTVMYSAIA